MEIKVCFFIIVFFLPTGGNDHYVQGYDVDKNIWITLPDVGFALNVFLLGLSDKAKLLKTID